MTHDIQARELAAFVLTFVGCMVALHFCGGCKPAAEPLNVENAAAVAQYDQALVACKERAKAVHSFALYLECEAAVTKHFCESSEALRQEWPRCKEGP